MSDPLGIESYGYPKIDFLHTDKRYLRYSEGWFLPEQWEDEPSCYIDFYFAEDGTAFLVLDAWYSYIVKLIDGD